MVRYRLAKVLRSVHVKAFQTRKKSGFENLLLQGLASHFDNLKLCCCYCYIISSTYGRITLIISSEYH